LSTPEQLREYRKAHTAEVRAKDRVKYDTMTEEQRTRLRAYQADYRRTHKAELQAKARAKRAAMSPEELAQERERQPSYHKLRRVYQSEYWQANKATLLMKRRVQRYSKTEEELEQERVKARERDARKRKRIAALIAAAERLVATLDVIENAPASDTSENVEMEFENG
jgi:hypothetical protein